MRHGPAIHRKVFLSAEDGVFMAGDIILFFTAFALIILAETGDKTQFSVITLGTRYPAVPVMLGSILAFALVNGVAVVAGVFILMALPIFWVKIGAAVLFLLFGAYTLYGLKTHDEEERDGEIETGERNGFISSFSLIFLMELGDKTQIATASLVAGYGHPLLIFCAVLLALSLLTVVEVKLGAVLSKKVEPERMKLIAGAIFILFGIITLIEALFTDL